MKRGRNNEDYAYDTWRQERDDLIYQAFQDILAGRFDTEAVHLAMKLGTHEDYPKLKEAHDVALRAARHSGAPA